MSHPGFIIKCNTGFMQYLYWNGTAWTREIVRARSHATRVEALKELGRLSKPTIAITAPEVMTMDAHDEENEKAMKAVEQANRSSR